MLKIRLSVKKSTYLDGKHYMTNKVYVSEIGSKTYLKHGHYFFTAISNYLYVTNNPINVIVYNTTDSTR